MPQKWASRNSQRSRAIGSRTKYRKLRNMTVVVVPMLILMVLKNLLYFEDISATKEAPTQFKSLPRHVEPFYAPAQSPQQRKKPQGRLYTCGYPLPLAPYIFPEYEFMNSSEWITNDVNHSRENDILMIGLYGDSCNHGKGDEKTSFVGKMVYVNGEPMGDVISNVWQKKEMYNIQKIYQMGPYPREPNHQHSQSNYEKYRENHSIQVYHTAMIFLARIYLDTRHDNFDPWKQLTEGNGGNDTKQKPRISAIVYVSRNCVGFRQQTASLLARTFRDNAISLESSQMEANWKVKALSSSFLHYGGQCQVEWGIPVPSSILEGQEIAQRENFHSNYKTIYTRYKYCLVMENTKKDGYVTEKLLHALLGGCLPIYYGSKDVYKIFRNDAFIYIDIDDPEPALQEIRNLEANHTEYLRRTNRSLPLLKATFNHDKFSTANTVDDYFSLIPAIGSGKLCREIHQMMGLPIPESLLTKN